MRERNLYNIFRYSFERLRVIWRDAPVLARTALVILGFECLAVFVAPFIVPANVYLSWYLPDRAKDNHSALLEGRHTFLLHDSTLGWRTRPGVQRTRWKIDQFGGRTTSPYKEERSEKVRLLFLGNSLVNGGTHIDNADTMSAKLESENTEALNFATMMYGIDQSLLAYPELAQRFRPDIVIVGLSRTPTSELGNRYVPFRFPEEVNVSYFKPRFVLTEAGLNVLPVPPVDEQRKFLHEPKLLSELSGTDAFYPELESFARFRLSPFATIGLKIFRRIVPDRSGELSQSPYYQTLIAILRQFQQRVEASGGEIRFLYFPVYTDVEPNYFEQQLGDTYRVNLEQMRAEGLKLIDLRQILRASPEFARDAYTRDGIHFSAKGNRIAAGGLREELTETIESYSKGMRKVAPPA